jgi:hypothetical protein
MREPADADVARVSKIVRATMTGLRAKLMRSISYYRAHSRKSVASSFDQASFGRPASSGTRL